MFVLYAAAFFATIASPRVALPTEVYRPDRGGVATWRVNENNTLIWNDKPYLPVGLRIPGTIEAVQEAKKRGISDVIVELPVDGTGWTETLAELEKLGMRYLIALSGMAPEALGYVIEPQSYRLTDVTESVTAPIKIPGASVVFGVVTLARDRSISKAGKLKQSGDEFVADIPTSNGLKRSIFLYPRTRSAIIPNYWEGLDRHRDLLLRALMKVQHGPGLRGIVNPLGETWKLQNRRASFVPDSAAFRIEFRNYLETKYKSVETCMRAWSMSTAPIDTFEGLARLVPLWSSSNQGVNQLWDPETDRLHPIEVRRSVFWSDIDDTIARTASRRFSRLLAAVKQVVNVPIVQEWAGWSGVYDSPGIGLTGIGGRAEGDIPLDIAASASRAASAILRWVSPGWMLASDISLRSGNPNLDVHSALDELASMGYRGWFVRASGESTLKALADDAAKRPLDASVASWKPKTLYFSESTFNPANPQRLPQGVWWLPSPARGNRIDLGGPFEAYRYEDGATSFTAIWSKAGTVRVHLKFSDPKVPTFRNIDGSDPKAHVDRQGVDIYIGPYPLIVENTPEIPVPDLCFDQTSLNFDELMKSAAQVRVDPTEEHFYFVEAANSFARNPGGTFLEMRRLFWKLNQKVGRFVWTEAENLLDNNFSEIRDVPGCASNSVLTLTSEVAPLIGPYYAEGNVVLKSGEDQSVWVAARMSDSARPLLRVLIAGQSLIADGPSSGRYGDGFGWYNFGTIRVPAGPSKLRIEFPPVPGMDLAIDTILIASPGFKPNGIHMPDAIGYTQLEPKRK